ncbi:MAG: type II toxin-antitoxin system Phd/YefM family antitoxin [Acidobacteria bacterium]|nr:type II toxin-antitoxin system Phd/YefM family antitoxin [Acidobacteriota bacterium]
MSFNIKEAKENLDLILDLAESGRPQVIKRGTKEVAVIVSARDWKQIEIGGPGNSVRYREKRGSDDS